MIMFINTKGNYIQHFKVYQSGFLAQSSPDATRQMKYSGQLLSFTSFPFNNHSIFKLF